MIALPGWAILEIEEKKMAGMLELPESAKTETQIGVIVALPESQYFVESGVLTSLPEGLIKVGDKVAFRKYHSSEIEVEGKKYQSVHLENLIVKL